MKVKCLMHSTAGKKGEIKDFSDNRARQLIDKKIVEEYKETKTKTKAEETKAEETAKQKKNK